VLDHFVVQIDDDIDPRIPLVFQIQLHGLQGRFIRDNILTCLEIMSFECDQTAVVLPGERSQKLVPLIPWNIDSGWTFLRRVSPAPREHISPHVVFRQNVTPAGVDESISADLARDR
jgi:hypothetical protein